MLGTVWQEAHPSTEAGTPCVIEPGTGSEAGDLIEMKESST